MRIVVHDYGGYPFVLQLSRALAHRGHEVLHLHGGGVRRSRAAMNSGGLQRASLAVEAVAIAEPLVSRAGLRRLLQERRYGNALAEHIREFQPDVVLSVPPSLDAQAAALAAARTTDAGFVYWIQDLYGQAVERLLGRPTAVFGKLIARRFHKLEQRLIRSSDAVIAITSDFEPILHDWRIDPAKISVIPNWAPLAESATGDEAAQWASEHSLSETPILLYAGTLGRKHSPDLLITLAEQLPAATVLVASEGAGTETLRSKSRPANLVMLPLQPPERVAAMLSNADVLLALLDADANVFSVPSKVLTYLAAGRPILAAIPATNLAARTIKDAGAGVVVDPGDHDAFVSGGKALINDPDRRASAGRAARKYAEARFEIGPIAEQFESILRGSIPARLASPGSDKGADRCP